MKGIYTIGVVVLGVLGFAEISFAQKLPTIISDVRTSGVSAQDEFIKLYNSTSANINISEWSIQYKSATGNKFYKKNFLNGSQIPAHGYFLIAHKKYSGEETPNMSHASFSMADSGGSIYLVDSQQKLKDTNSESIVATYHWGEGVVEPTPPQEKLATGPETVEPLLVSAPPSPSPKPSTAHSSRNVILNELFPNPTGNDAEGEWIEIKNLGSQEADITNWVIGDSSKTYNVGSFRIKPKTTVILKRSQTKIALNNSGDETVVLQNSNGEIVDRVSYHTPVTENSSFARASSRSWSWTTTPTPREDNIITEPIINDESPIEEEKEQEFNSNEPSDSPAAPYYNVRINELLPNPAGSDEEGEWIELYNFGERSINLRGYIIGDSSQKTHSLANHNLTPNTYINILRSSSKISLNNRGDEIKLWAPDGTLIDRAVYINPEKEGSSYAINERGLWDWSIKPTPGEENTFPVVLGETIKPEEGQDEMSEPTTISDQGFIPTTISAIRTSFDVGDAVTIQGVVAVEPGLLGKTYFYITKENTGIKIYVPKQNFPELSLGDEVQISGIISETNNETQIKTSGDEIAVTGFAGKPDPEKISISEINEQHEGMLITVSGIISERSGSSVLLSNQESEIKVYFAGEVEIEKSIFAKEKEFSVTGFVSETKTGYRILPRYPEDVKLLTTTPDNKITTVEFPQKERGEKHKRTILMVLVLLIVFVIIHKRKRRANAEEDSTD